MYIAVLKLCLRIHDTPNCSITADMMLNARHNAQPQKYRLLFYRCTLFFEMYACLLQDRTDKIMSSIVRLEMLKSMLND